MYKIYTNLGMLKRHIQKLLLIMRLVTVIILATMLHASASSYGQRITLNVKSTSITAVFREIRRQTGYDFLYDSKLLSKTRSITIYASNEPLEKVLGKLFADMSLTYKIENKAILLRSKEISVLDILTSIFQQIDVTGRILDENRKPLSGATVMIKGTGKSTVTDDKGIYRLQNVQDNDVVVISYVGFKNMEIPVSPKMGDLSLSRVDEVLQEVTVNSGYQSLLKERAPGAYDQVNQDILSRRPVANLSTALQGMVAGMQGKENADGSVNFLIRGSTSLYADRSPLVVIDGFPVANGDFSTINPNDVESVTVLKDAAAASIWGARSANGVIVVTTKKAKNGANGLQVDANVFTRISERPNLNQLILTTNSTEQIAYEKMAFNNGWFFSKYAGGFPFDMFKPTTLAQEFLFAHENGEITTNNLNASLDSLAQINNENQLQDLLLRRNILTQYNISLSSFGEKSKTYSSLLFEDNKSRFQGSDSKRYAINFNNEYKPYKFVTLNFGLYLQYRKQNNSGASLEELRALSPYETLLNGDGSYASNLKDYNRGLISSLPSNSFPYPDWSYNLLREVRGRKLLTQNYSARIQGGLTFKLLPGLTFDTKIQYERGENDVNNYFNEDTYYARNLVNFNIDYDNDAQVVNQVFLPKGGIGKSSNGNTSSYVFRNQISFSRDLGSKHNINAIVGVEKSSYRTEVRTNPWLYGYYPDKLRSTVPVYGYGSANDQFVDITGSPTTLDGGNTIFNYNLDNYMSYYGNAAYTYDGKYTLSGSLRNDASNFITKIPSLRWEPLWSVGALWNIKRESLFNKMSWLDRLALRVTYGRNGNVEKSSSTNTLLSVGTSPNAVTGTVIASILDNGNPTLRWEKTTTTNFGLDFSLYQGKLNGKIDVYNKVGTDIAGVISLATATGTRAQLFNNAGITNRGIEIELGSNFKIPGIPLFYTTSLNYAFNKNNVANLYFPSLYINQLLESQNVFVQGRPVNPVYSFTYGGTLNGVPQVIGLNGQPSTMNNVDLIYDGLGTQILNYEGTGTPPHTMGWYNSFSFKGFQLSALVIGKFGGVYRNDTFNYPFVGSDKTIVNRYISDVFAGRDDIPSFPVQNEREQYLWQYYVPYLSGLIEKSSYIELKELTLDYTIPSKIMSRLGLRNLKIYTQARDLGLLWSANRNGYNPDWLPGTDRPAKAYTIGVNIGF